MSELYLTPEKFRDKITPDHAFRILNTFINFPCVRYARRVLAVLPQIRVYVNYYEKMLREGKMSPAQKGMVSTFVSEYYHALQLLSPMMEEIKKAEMEVLPVC